eukprot:scaffold19878_cov88-Isochrysis_galbana.AAC.1
MCLKHRAGGLGGGGVGGRGLAPIPPTHLVITLRACPSSSSGVLLGGAVVSVQDSSLPHMARRICAQVTELSLRRGQHVPQPPPAGDHDTRSETMTVPMASPSLTTTSLTARP